MFQPEFNLLTINQLGINFCVLSIQKIKTIAYQLSKTQWRNNKIRFPGLRRTLLDTILSWNCLVLGYRK